MSQINLGDSLARGIAHHMGRESLGYVLHRIKTASFDKAIRTDCRTTAYKTVTGLLTHIFGEQLMAAHESGIKKQRQWYGHVTSFDEQAGLSLQIYNVPFKSPLDIDHKESAIRCHPHAVQRIVQILGLGDPMLVSALWLSHGLIINRALSQSPVVADADRIMSFDDTALLIWRPATSGNHLWETITAIRVDTLYGNKKKRHDRLLAGIRDTGVYGVNTGEALAFFRPTIQQKLRARTRGILSEARGHRCSALIVAA